MSLRDESHPEGLQPSPAERIGTQPPAATAHGAALPPPHSLRPWRGIKSPQITVKMIHHGTGRPEQSEQGHRAARAAPAHRQHACT